MTISSLAKIIVGVNRMVVENVESEYPEINPTLIMANQDYGSERRKIRPGIRERRIKKTISKNSP